jgi:lysophospholipase L1-like esterase
MLRKKRHLLKATALLLIETFAVALFLTACSRPPSGALPPQATAMPRPQISAADPRFHYEGRFDFSAPDAPVIIWQASRIRLDFSGDSLGLLLDNPQGQNYFNVEVDGSNTVVEASAGKPVNPATLSGLGSGRHHLVIFKRTEAAAGTATFRGVELAAGAQAWAGQPPAYQLRMEFIGDSITVGACNEDGDTDQWKNRRTHNAASSYAALTAAACQADHRNISVSGMGIITGYVPMQAGETWRRLYPAATSPRADLEHWQPQLVFVNFGENDDSFTRGHGRPFPDNFTAGYVALIRDIRQTYPGARIVLLRGGMYGGAQSEPLRAAWQAAVDQLESSDAGISHFAFTHWSHTHPRVADDQIMANELVAWLKQQPPTFSRKEASQ